MHVAFFLAYVALFRISYIFQTSDLRSTPWNPEAGIAVVSGIVLGWSSLPVIFLASIASKLTNPSILTLGWEIVAAVAKRTDTEVYSTDPHFRFWVNHK